MKIREQINGIDITCERCVFRHYRGQACALSLFRKYLPNSQSSCMQGGGYAYNSNVFLFIVSKIKLV